MSKMDSCPNCTYGVTGGDHSPENIHLMCRTHNAYLAELDYGKEVMERYRRSGNCAREPAPVYSIGGRTIDTSDTVRMRADPPRGTIR